MNSDSFVYRASLLPTEASPKPHPTPFFLQQRFTTLMGDPRFIVSIGHSCLGLTMFMTSPEAAAGSEFGPLMVQQRLLGLFTSTMCPRFQTARFRKIGSRLVGLSFCPSRGATGLFHVRPRESSGYLMQNQALSPRGQGWILVRKQRLCSHLLLCHSRLALLGCKPLERGPGKWSSTEGVPFHPTSRTL